MKFNHIKPQLNLQVQTAQKHIMTLEYKPKHVYIQNVLSLKWGHKYNQNIGSQMQTKTYIGCTEISAKEILHRECLKYPPNQIKT